MVKPKNYTEGEEAVKEQDEEVPPADEKGEEEEKDLDVDKKVEEAVGKPGGPIKGVEDKDYDELEEAFQLFKEEIDAEEDEEEEEKEEEKEE